MESMRFALPDVDRGGVWLDQAPMAVSSRAWVALSPWIVATRRRREDDGVLVARLGAREETSLSEDRTQLLLVRRDEENLYLAVRQAIRQRLIYMAEQDGWTQIHSAAARLPNGKVVLFVGNKRAGKTSSVLALCTRLPSTCLIANDRVLVNPENEKIIGFPSAIGMGRVTKRVFGLRQPCQYLNGKYWLWPKEAARELGFGLERGGSAALVIAPSFRRRAVALRIRDAECRQLLTANVEMDALAEDNWWRIERPTRQAYGAWFHHVAWPSSVKAFAIVTEGLSPHYTDALQQLSMSV